MMHIGPGMRYEKCLTGMGTVQGRMFQAKGTLSAHLGPAGGLLWQVQTPGDQESDLPPLGVWNDHLRFRREMWVTGYR